MKFKEFLTFLYEKGTSYYIWDWVTEYRLPVSPKFFEEIFYKEKKTETCFIAMEFNRIPSLKRRQNKKNQMSTFQRTKDTNIFWGAGARSWYNWSEDHESVVAEIKGQVTLEGNSDMWAFPDGMGRRWIDVPSILRYNTELTNTLGQIRKELKTIYQNQIPRLDLEVKYFFNSSGNIVFRNIDDYPKDKAKLIKNYIGIANALLKKYKNKLLNIIKEQPLAPKAHYQETLCYNYTITKLWILTDNKEATFERHKDELKGLRYDFTTPDKLLKHVNSANKKA